MEFKTRLSGFLFFQILLILALLSDATLDLLSPVFKTGFLHYNFIIYYLAGITWLLRIYRQIYSLITGKPILTINENYLYDFIDDIKYDWKDVEEIEEKQGFIYIKLYKPINYLNKIGNWHRRWVKKKWFNPTGKHSLFTIDSSLIAEDPNKLLEILNDYSLKAEGIENTLSLK